MEILKIENLEKSFGELSVLKDISLTVSSGEVVSLIGPSGSGKSTLLRCATMLETAEGGAISYLGESVFKDGAYTSKEAVKSARKVFGLVFQNFNLFPHWSVMKNITDAQINVLGRTKAQAEKKASELLEKMGLSDKAEAYPYQLSGGQQQRVSIARALALDPQIIFFDEPTSALDPELTGEILKVIRTLAADGMTMVIVTHEIEFARGVSDRVIFMADGVIVEQGAPDEVILNPKNERTAAFLQILEK